MLKKTIRKIPRNTKPRQLRSQQNPKSGKNGTLRNHVALKLKPAPKTKIIEERKTSDEKFPRDPKEYRKIKDLPIYEPTVAEFKQPLLLLRKLKELGYEKYGAVKIRAPKSFDPEFSFNQQEKKLTTRIQLLRDLSKGKDFDQNVNAYTQEEFQEFADDFSEKYIYKTNIKENNIYRKNEYEFWSLVEDPAFERNKVEVEYAADLPSRKYGSGFPTIYRSKATDELDPSDARTHPFNLNNISHAKDSMFQIISTKMDNISGITSPWVYSGMLFASFCWHVEDLYMNSLNYMHVGSPKTWYIVPGEYKEAFDKVIKEKFANLFEKKPGLLYNITLQMNPLELIENNIPVYKTDQGPREYIMTFPKVYHCGFSHGYNVSEAVNFATPDWIPFGKEAVEAYANEGHLKKASFPYEWVVLENMLFLEDLEYSKLAKDELLRDFGIIKNKEMKEREAVLKCYNKVNIRQFDNKLTRYDVHMCSVCKNYCYLSFLQCSHCNKKACPQHITVCQCITPNVSLNVRFTEKELNDMSKEMKTTKGKKK